MAGLSIAAASPPHPQESASSSPRPHRPEATPFPGEKGLPYPKSKASTPGMAWPIRRDAGTLCDRAWRAFRLQRPHRHTHKNPHPPARALTGLKRHLIPARKACHARRAKRPRQGWRGRSAGMRESFAIGHGGPFVRSGLKRHHIPPRKAFRSQRPHRHTHLRPNAPLQKKRQAGFPLTCRFCNEPQLMPDNLLVFSRVVFVFRFRCNLFIVSIRFRRDIILALRHAAVD